MTLDLMVWSADRQAFVDGMTAYGFATLGEGSELIPRDCVLIDEIGQIVKPGTYDENGAEISPPVVVDGHHVNIRVTGKFAAEVSAGCPSEGTIFERTHILSMIPGLTWEPINVEGVPAGYVGLHGVRLYDPASVTIPHRCWA